MTDFQKGPTLAELLATNCAWAPARRPGRPQRVAALKRVLRAVAGAGRGGEEAFAGQVLKGLVGVLEECGPLPGRLERSVREALTSETPIRTAAKLASRVRCSRYTLWREWREEMGEVVSLPDLLTLIAIARYERLRAEGAPAALAAARLHTTPQRIYQQRTRLRRVLAWGGGAPEREREVDGRLAEGA